MVYVILFSLAAALVVIPIAARLAYVAVESIREALFRRSLRGVDPAYHYARRYVRDTAR